MVVTDLRPLRFIQTLSKPTPAPRAAGAHTPLANAGIVSVLPDPFQAEAAPPNPASTKSLA
jgi:hypothetical protein